MSKSPSLSAKPSQVVDNTRFPIEDHVESPSYAGTRTTFHVYQEEVHIVISPAMDNQKERRSGPSLKQQKAKRKAKDERKEAGLPRIDSDDVAFFLHRPYLAFHVPPRVLYTGNNKLQTPTALIHAGPFWRWYKIQVGPSIANVLDPHGVVAWKHNGGSKQALKKDDRSLQGYKVRTWRLWGETGKNYVHSVKGIRKAGEGLDPDVLGGPGSRPDKAAKADDVVYLRWTNPISQHTRCYQFQYAGIDFSWKGTGTVKEPRMCGLLLRYNHLKLVAKAPAAKGKPEELQPEFCLGRYTSSIAEQKHGTLEFFDAAILGLIQERVPSMLAGQSPEKQSLLDEAGSACRMSRMKRSMIYNVLVATAMCMILSEKEKRHTLGALLCAVAEGGGG